MEVRQKWFAEDHPINAESGVTVIGSGKDGEVSIITKIKGEIANEYTIEVVEGSEEDVDMSAVLIGKDLVITLGTDDNGDLDDTKNTAGLIATEINKIGEFIAEASGEGTDPIQAAVTKANFEDGCYGTVCHDTFVVVQHDDDFYVNIAPNGKCDANWRVFNLSKF